VIISVLGGEPYSGYCDIAFFKPVGDVSRFVSLRKIKGSWEDHLITH
jgi:hypothetical protein